MCPRRVRGRILEHAMRHLLPVGPPLLRTYLFYLHPLSILAQEARYLPWLYSRCIQLLHYPGECLKMLLEPGSTSPQVSHAYALSCPLLDVQSLELEAVTALNPDPAAACAALIGRGYYVQTDADFFHLAHRPEYGRQHFLHEILFHGVDADTGLLVALVHGPRGDPVQVAVEPEALRRATADLASVRCTRAAADDSPSSWWSEVASWGRPRVFVYRYHPERSCGLDVDSVREQIAEYLGAFDSSQRHRLSGAARPGGVWGMAVYGWLHDQLEQMRTGRAEWEPLTWRVLWEHKACMHRRLEFMGLHGTPSAVALAAQYGPAVSWVRSLQLVLLRWSSAPSPAALELAHGLLCRTAALEAKVLEQLLTAG
jgi:hypothetical protein